ncbi:DUF4142 domain-containing protein [Sphingomonas ginkgonis]|uniref:DUF4142 domain-containing protein n=1 Tax=Sphingomonas ginkgonis TaxID=2315330 RepID=A0A429VD37_9SPHN|nr:DUF4142 domain-containing protein [Sphingomonas ginkgonis]RST31767.1 DUF4142 domain-containing protein [Sphingomonas ginkgonis]
MFRILSAGVLLAASTAAVAAPAPQFLKKAAMGDTSEARLGTLIASRGASAQTRRFGAMLVRDHSAHRAKVDALAARMHVQVMHQPVPEARSEYAKLQGMRGRAFDMEVRRYMIDDHQKDIADNREQAAGREPMTAQLARNTLPTLQRHLQMARSL